MLSVLVAVALHAAAIEQPQSHQSGPPPSEESEAPPADDTADPSSSEPTNGSQAEEPEAQQQEQDEEVVEEVCSRRTVYDSFGRQRSRRVCRPR